MNGNRLHARHLVRLSSLSLLALFLLPAAAEAQRATGTLIVRVEDGGLPASGVGVAAVLRRSAQPLGTTGASGLLAVEELPLDIARGTRVSTGVLRCPGGETVLLIPEFQSLGEVPADCEQIPAGHFFWGQVDRIMIRLDGDVARLDETRTAELRAALSGWRLQGSFLFTALMGSEFDNNKDGIGGDLKLFYIWSNGLGLGGGGSWTTHDVVGIDENLFKWSAYLEPRYTFFFPSTKLRPHILGRVSHNWFAYEDGVNLSENGWGFGGGLGAAYPIAGWLAIDLTAYLGYLSVSAESSAGTTFTRSGTEIQLTAGLRFF